MVLGVLFTASGIRTGMALPRTNAATIGRLPRTSQSHFLQAASPNKPHTDPPPPRPPPARPLLLLVAYPVLARRIFFKQRRQNICTQHAALYALSCVVGKFAQIGGTLGFLRTRLLGTKSTLIEYKN